MPPKPPELIEFLVLASVLLLTDITEFRPGLPPRY